MNRNLLKLLSVAFLLAAVFAMNTVQAQRAVCGSDELREQMLQEYPQARSAHEQVETIYQNAIQTGQARTGGVRTIPVVVHIIQSSNIELVSMADVQSQIDVLNEDFRKIAGTNGDGAGVDTEYEFCLATIDPNGCPTDGVNRLVHPTLAYHDKDDETLLKGLIQWPPTKYLNMWVPRTIETSSSTGQIIGYAVFPQFLPFAPSRDGVVIHSGYFGRNADPQYLGRTTTHEVGHWLGLYHTFQNGCSGATAATCGSNGDRVCDTPQAFEANFGCPSINSCTDSPVDDPDQIENYMDYSNGSCQNMFTAGQDARMDVMVDNYRSVLHSASNLTATGCDGTTSPGCAPTAEFTADNVNTCVGQPVQFIDLSAGPATSWDWTFSGGTPATSTDQNPVVTYAAPGTYTVSLEATNALGNHTESKTGFITITSPAAPPLVEGFEGIIFLPTGWATEDGDGVGTWELVTGASTEGQNSMKMKNFEANNEGSYDNLNSHVIDLSYTQTASMTFDYSYKKLSGFNADTLKVRVSTDCGSSWTTVWEKGGPYLATVGGLQVASEWVPSQASHWLSDTVSLDTFAGNQNVRVQFRNVGGNGQSVYIDNINMDYTLVGAADPSTVQWSMHAAPNPFYDVLNVNYQLAKASKMRFILTDVNGRVLYSHETGKLAAGKYSVPMGADIYGELPNGIYFIKGESDFGSITTKVVKMD